MQYNKNTAGNWGFADVPDGYYVNYYEFVTTSNTSKKERYIIPGQNVFSSKSEAIVKQMEEAYDLVTAQLTMPEYKAVGVVLLRYDSSYTNTPKTVVVSVGGGLDYTDLRNKSLGSGRVKIEDVVIPVHLTRDVHEDVIVDETDMEIDFDTSSGNLTATLKTISSLLRKDRRWSLRKITQDGNYVDIVLQTITDAISGPQHRTHRLSKMGDAIVIGITENDKYYFEMVQSAKDIVVHPAVATLSPEVAGTTLTMNADLLDLAGDASITAGFRYREIGAASWINSNTSVKYATGTFIETETVTSGIDYEVQAVLTDINGDYWYGDVKTTLSNYYSDIAAAQSDGMLRYWDMQEDTGIDTVAVEKFGTGDDFICTGGVAIDHDVINTITIYKRKFAGNAWMESVFKMDWTWTGTHVTLMIQAEVRTTLGDHTLFSCGRNIFSCAADNTSIQVNVDNAIQSWNSATPSGMINMFFVINNDDWYTRLFTVTPTAVTQRTTVWDNPDNKAEFFRIARGTSGDGNHQETEYMDDGYIGQIGIWAGVKSSAEMMDMADKFSKGMLIV
jgi:hypothetical protein